MRTTLFFAIAIVITSLFSSCKKNETIAPIELQSEKAIDNSTNWLVGRLRIDGDDISLQDVFVLIDKYSVVITSGNFTATAPSSFQPNSEIVIGQFDIVQNGQLSTQNGTPVGVDKAFVRFVSAMETTLKYQKNSAHIILSASNISVILLQVGQKNANAIVNTSWEVQSVVSVPKNVSINWSTKNPKLNFFNDYIELKMGRDICNKHFMIAGDDLIINYANCVIGNQNQQNLSDLMEGRFKYLISDNGEEMILKNDLETEITLRRVVQLGTSTVTANISNNVLIQ